MTFKKIFKIYVYVWESTICTQIAMEVRARAQNPLELESQGFVSWQTWLGKLHSGPLEVQQMLLTAGLSLHAPILLIFELDLKKK